MSVRKTSFSSIEASAALMTGGDLSLTRLVSAPRAPDGAARSGGALCNFGTGPLVNALARWGVDAAGEV